MLVVDGGRGFRAQPRRAEAAYNVFDRPVKIRMLLLDHLPDGLLQDEDGEDDEALKHVQPSKENPNHLKSHKDNVTCSSV